MGATANRPMTMAIQYPEMTRLAVAVEYPSSSRRVGPQMPTPDCTPKCTM